jgi:hypothetical protein
MMKISLTLSSGVWDGMGLEKLGSSSFSAVKAQVEQTYSREGKWFSGIQAWFATVKHCLGFKQEKVQQALEALNSTDPVVPHTLLHDMAASRTAGTKTIEANTPGVQAALTDIKSEFNNAIRSFRLEGNVTRGVLRQLSDDLDGMLAKLYTQPLSGNSNADKVHNAIYVLKGNIDNFLNTHAKIADDQVPPGTDAFKQETLGQAIGIGMLPEWGT